MSGSVFCFFHLIGKIKLQTHFVQSSNCFEFENVRKTNVFVPAVFVLSAADSCLRPVLFPCVPSLLLTCGLCVSVCVQQLWSVFRPSALHSDGSLHLHHLSVVRFCQRLYLWLQTHNYKLQATPPHTAVARQHIRVT